MTKSVFFIITFIAMGFLFGCGEDKGQEPEEIAEADASKDTEASKPKTFKGKDGADMILIPAGEFLMGSPDLEGDSDERPQHTVYLDAFYIDKYEVTNAQYKKFMEATGRPAPKFWGDANFNVPNLPVVGVTGQEAEAYAAWAGKRLPTEAEWEKAARGADGRRYPWGNEFNMNIGNKTLHANIVGNLDGFIGASPVGSFASGASPFQVMDMAGNVWEWVADWYDANYYRISPKENPKGSDRGPLKVLRGGSWGTDSVKARIAERASNDPRSSGNNTVGFRTAQDLEKKK